MYAEIDTSSHFIPDTSYDCQPYIEEAKTHLLPKEKWQAMIYKTLDCGDQTEVEHGCKYMHDLLH